MLKSNERNNPIMQSPIMQSLIMQRFMAYWIFTYGVLRIYSGYNNNYELAAISYFIEAAIISNECFIYKSMVLDRSVFVIISSIGLGGLCWYSSKGLIF
jgi:hypothetical protein